MALAPQNPHLSAVPIAVQEEHEREPISPARLNISWGNDKRYWRLPDSNHPTAELKQVCWLEVALRDGVNGLTAGEEYKIGFRISLKQDMFGWSKVPVFVMAKFGKKGQYKWKPIYLEHEVREREFDIPRDGGLSVVVPNRTTTSDALYFGLYEVWSGKWKGGLEIHHAFIRKRTTTN